MRPGRERKALIIIAVIGVIVLLFAPEVLELFSVLNLTTAISFSILALSLGLIWGFGGILCFGQTAFFGIGAYAYTIAAINFGGSSWAILLLSQIGWPLRRTPNYSFLAVLQLLSIKKAVS